MGDRPLGAGCRESSTPRLPSPAGRDSLRAVDTAVVTGAGAASGARSRACWPAAGMSVLVTDTERGQPHSETADLLGERAWPMALDVRDPEPTGRPRPRPTERGP